jgi:hypothetical protein
VSDENPPPAFNWNLTPKVPKDPDDEAEKVALPPAVPPPVTQPPPQAYVGEPTEAYTFDAFDSSMPTAEVLGGQPVGLPQPQNEATPTSPIDALFGETQFKEYDGTVFPVESPAAALALSRSARAEKVRGERQPIQRTQKVLLWIAGGLVAVLALVGLFLAGTKLSGVFAQPTPVASPTPSAIALVEAKPSKIGPLAPGSYSWSALLGTECLQPYASAWDEKYTVVDCAAPHTAQLVYHGIFGDEAFAPYPGLPALLTRINLLCSAPTAINYAAASQFTDIQISASYTATESDWAAGKRDYYCFVTRSSGDPLTASVAVAPAAPAITPGVPGNDP